MDQNDAQNRLIDTARQVDKLEVELATHEVQCEERWKTNFQRLDTIDDTLSRMDQRMSHIGLTVIIFLAGVIVTLVQSL